MNTDHDTIVAPATAAGGAIAVIRISGGEAFMKWADCPDKLCIRQGKISHTGETIACLPNRVTVRVISGAASNVDSIAG